MYLFTYLLYLHTFPHLFQLGDPSDGPSTLRWKSFAKIGSGHGETSDANSSGSFIDPNVEPDKVVLRPHNRNHPLLSPREQEMPREVNKKHLPCAENSLLSKFCLLVVLILVSKIFCVSPPATASSKFVILFQL